jgi:hypothetical protein
VIQEGKTTIYRVIQEERTINRVIQEERTTKYRRKGQQYTG